MGGMEGEGRTLSLDKILDTPMLMDMGFRCPKIVFCGPQSVEA